ncbi:MAG: anti-sigma factor [Algibacter sp.]|uniref:anti-sigma factor n=1 Tax=Algibacter sp. TaxID=1872428 RepID=UPI002622BE11|nr:anti-sigma factor [Algibacter sp.]MDG1729981.1 anti-sigma factor [Algibacter sp.]MDG2177223.1 anti-sigma factor [Algibacter sp.]
MNEKITTFLNSGLLDKYLLGETTTAEAEMVESYITRYPEIENTYNTMQYNLEVVAKANAVEAPKNILNTILDELDDTPVVKLKTSYTYKKWYKFSIAASIAALIFAGTSYLFYNHNQKLSNENQVVVEELFDLRSDIEQNNKMLDKVMRQLLKLNNPETEKYIIKGNERAKDLKTVAYINPKEKTSMIDVVSLPELPEEQCYQIWAELQGKMVNLGILDKADRKLRNIPYMEDALALSITIEPKGGNSIASTRNSVAQINLQ